MKYEHRQKSKPASVAARTAAAAALFVSLSVFTACVPSEVIPPETTGASSEVDGEENQHDGDEIQIEGEADVDTDTADAKPYYYDSTREDRYIAFAEAHPELETDDVYWMVDCDLDLPPYEDTHEIEDADDILLLVNKHFYLPEGYAPADLVNVGATMMRAEAGAAMQEMIDAAEAEGLNIWSQSGYRSYGVQVNLYWDYSARDGEEAADTYSARPGYSEHQTGLTTDLNTITDAFGETAEGKWVAENCWKYGYIVRYTKENTDVTLYKPEPWHMRYIGRAAAGIMHDARISSFEEYWVKYVRYAPYAPAAVG